MLFQATIRKRRDTYSRKYREVPHPKLYFVSYCEQLGSAYVDSDIFILKGASRLSVAGIHLTLLLQQLTIFSTNFYNHIQHLD